MRIGVASDHAGFRYKEAIIAHLREQGHEVADYGTFSAESTDYPIFIRPLALDVAAGKLDRGVVLGGSGNGEAMVANRVPGVRCGLAWNEDSARLTRQHNDANVLSLGERMLDLETALRLVDIFLTEPFEGGRHTRRIDLIDAPD